MTKRQKKQKHKNEPTFNKKSLTNKILGIISNGPQKSFNYKQLSGVINLKDSGSKKLITKILYELKEIGYLEEISLGKFRLKSKAGYISGTVDLTSKGYAYIISEDISEDVFVSQKNLKHALHGDKVKIYLYVKRKSYQLEGEVVQILERAKTQFVGTLEVSRNFAFLIPDSRKMPYDIFIPPQALKGGRDGQKAVAKITEWPEKSRNPIGKITDVLGDPGENETEMHSILAEFGLPYKFPNKVFKAAEQIPDKITEHDIRERKDFRKEITFTIDPVDAKDFDDALSLKKLDNGNWEAGIHIADVTHYVKPNTIPDKEAYKRGTSVYLVDRVVPMLPEQLSNKVCSLRPDEDKLCYSAVFEINNNADILKQWIGKTIIRSKKRFTYEEAQEIIESGKGTYSAELQTMNRLAKKLREKRFKSGSINFERLEVRFELDDDGKPLGVYNREFNDSNKLIEEFMLLANKKVAELIGKPAPHKKRKTFVYRVHDKPDPDKISRLSQLIKRFGYNLNTASDRTLRSSMNKLIKDVEGKNEQGFVETLAIRSMAKAEYSTHNIGHYGLAFTYYSHFTSPIRRYPDMMVHRLLDHYLNKGKSVNEKKYENMCKYASVMEQRAENAERTSIKYKQVEFMQDKIGQVFSGIISGVAEWGIYVELVENKCEGLVPVRDMDDDYYLFDENNYCIRGKNNRKEYRLGDEVQVVVASADIMKRRLDFSLSE